MTLEEALKSLTVKTPVRLSGGLALRLSKMDGGFFVLGCSRIGQKPSAIEINTVVAAVARVWQPQRIWRGTAPNKPVRHGGADHYVWRIYWTTKDLTVVYEVATQLALPVK